MSERYPLSLAAKLGLENNIPQIEVPTTEHILEAGRRCRIPWTVSYLGPSVRAEDGKSHIATAEFDVVVKNERLRRELGDSALCFAHMLDKKGVCLVDGSEHPFTGIERRPDGSAKFYRSSVKIGREEQPNLPRWISRYQCELTLPRGDRWIDIDNHSSSDMRILVPDMSRNTLPSGDSHNGDPVRRTCSALAEKPDYGEDANCLSDTYGIYGVFDGIGESTDGARAARFAADAVLKYAERTLDQDTTRQTLQEAIEWNQKILNFISATIMKEQGSCAGQSTATLARIIDQPDGGKFLTYANIGDSRIYIVRDNKACQITKDDGEGTAVTAALGRSLISEKTPWQYGCEKIFPGDTILVGTDGIWGDRGTDVMSDGEISLLVQSMHAKGVYDPKSIAQALLDRSRKHDDKTLIAISCS